MKQKMLFILVILFMLVIAYAIRTSENENIEEIDGFFEEVTLEEVDFITVQTTEIDLVTENTTETTTKKPVIETTTETTTQKIINERTIDEIIFSETTTQTFIEPLQEEEIEIITYIHIG